MSELVTVQSSSPLLREVAGQEGAVQEARAVEAAELHVRRHSGVHGLAFPDGGSGRLSSLGRASGRRQSSV